MNELLIYGGASFAFAAGYAFRAYFSRPSDAGYWKTIAEREEKRATENWNRFVDACRECNAIEEDYQEALASNRRLTKEKLATDNWNRFVDACRECNAIEEDYQEALASNRRLTDALQAKNERLERIVEAFEGQRSGTARKAVKIALGDL